MIAPPPHLRQYRKPLVVAIWAWQFAFWTIHAARGRFDRREPFLRGSVRWIKASLMDNAFKNNFCVGKNPIFHLVISFHSFKMNLDIFFLIQKVASITRKTSTVNHSFVSKLPQEVQSHSKNKHGEVTPAAGLLRRRHPAFPQRTSKPRSNLNIRQPCKSELQKEKAPISWWTAGQGPALCCTCRGRGVASPRRALLLPLWQTQLTPDPY